MFWASYVECGWILSASRRRYCSPQTLGYNIGCKSYRFAGLDRTPTLGVTRRHNKRTELHPNSCTLSTSRYCDSVQCQVRNSQGAAAALSPLSLATLQQHYIRVAGRPHTNHSNKPPTAVKQQQQVK